MGERGPSTSGVTEARSCCRRARGFTPCSCRGSCGHPRERGCGMRGNGRAKSVESACNWRGIWWCSPSKAGQTQWDSTILENQGFSAPRVTQSITRIALPQKCYPGPQPSRPQRPHLLSPVVVKLSSHIGREKPPALPASDKAVVCHPSHVAVFCSKYCTRAPRAGRRPRKWRGGRPPARPDPRARGALTLYRREQLRALAVEELAGFPQIVLGVAEIENLPGLRDHFPAHPPNPTRSVSQHNHFRQVLTLRCVCLEHS
jgi:hypothetical protein